MCSKSKPKNRHKLFFLRVTKAQKHSMELFLTMIMEHEYGIQFQVNIQRRTFIHGGCYCGPY